MTDIIAIVGDTHTTSTVGLCNHNQFTLDDGGVYRGSKGQRWLWRCWLEFWDFAHDLRAIHQPTRFVTIFMGDMIERDRKKRSKQIVSRNTADAVKAASATIEPAIEMSDLAFFIRGTGAHVGGSAEYEELLAYDCDIAVKNETGNSSWWRLLAEFEGVLIDAYHHAPMGSKPWTMPNAFNGLATELMLEYAGQKLPALAVRAHNHRGVDTFDNYPIRVIGIPSWQLMTEHTHRLSSNKPPSVGGLFVVCENGKYEVIKRTWEPERIRAWKMEKSTRSRTG